LAQEATAGEVPAEAKEVKLQQLFEKCLTSHGQAYVEARNALLKEKTLSKFLEARAQDLKKRPDREVETLCFYLKVWLKHGDAYRRILARDLDREKFGEDRGHATADSGPDLMGLLLKAFAKERASLAVLIESVHKSGEFGRKHGGYTCSLYLLGAMCASLEEWRDGPFLQWVELGGTDFVPKDLFLNAQEKKILVRVANRLVVEGPFQKHSRWSVLGVRSLHRRACAFVLKQLADASSVSPLVQAAIEENDKKTLDKLRSALDICSKSEEGKKALEAVKKKVAAISGG